MDNMRGTSHEPEINTNEFLKNVRIGLWRIEVEEGKLQ